MNLNKLLVVVALSAAAASAQANVATTTSGNVTTYSEDFNSGSSFTQGFFNAPGPDNYMWLSSPIPAGNSSSSYSFSSASTPGSVSVSFYYSALATAASWTFDGVTQGLSNTSTILFVPNNPGPLGNATADALVTYTFNSLAGTNHQLSFNSGIGGLKIDDVKIVVTAVPEPESYAMLLAGLCLMGTIARRRSRSK